MTNPIAGDMATPSIQILKAWLAILRKAAFTEGKSFGQKVRELIFEGAKVSDPELAAKLDEARLKRWAVNGIVFLVGSAAIFQATFGHSKIELRKPRVARQSMRQVIRRDLEPVIA